MSYTKGGRGKKAPYETVVIRVPKPLQKSVEQIIEKYRTTGKTNFFNNQPDQQLINEVVILETQKDYCFPKYQHILDKIEHLSTKAMFQQLTELIVVKNEIAILKTKSFKIKQMICTRHQDKVSILAKAFKAYYCGKQIDFLFVSNDEIVKTLSYMREEWQNPDYTKVSLLDLLDEETLLQVSKLP